MGTGDVGFGEVRKVVDGSFKNCNGEVRFGLRSKKLQCTVKTVLYIEQGEGFNSCCGLLNARL